MILCFRILFLIFWLLSFVAILSISSRIIYTCILVHLYLYKCFLKLNFQNFDYNQWTPGDLVVRSEVSLLIGPVALRQLTSIMKGAIRFSKSSICHISIIGKSTVHPPPHSFPPQMHRKKKIFIVEFINLVPSIDFISSSVCFMNTWM